MDEIINEKKLFSLDKFRKIKNNYFEDKEECMRFSKKYGNKYITNPRFEKKKFDQTYFTAGDFKDINKYGLLPVRYFYSLLFVNEIIEKEKKEEKEKIFKLYKNIDYVSIENTFDYMFNKFKKGIFIIIKDNKLITFLPFSNANYQNNWVKQTYFSDNEKNLLSKETDFRKIENKLRENILQFIRTKRYSSKINFQRNKWYANNCLFRNDFPPWEGELNINIYRNLIETLLKERKVNDVEFFINDRDFPLLKKDYTEPYNHLYDGENVKIEKEYQFKKMAPIFSKSITNDFADILLPTNDDWVMASNKYFTSACSNSYHEKSWNKINKKWDTKKNICIFRGSATGCGIDIHTNMRLKAADLSIDWPNILDAKITDWKARMKKYEGKPIDVIDPHKFRFKLEEKMMDNIEKSNYKYILNIDGYVSAFRLGSELNMNSVVLLVKSKYKLWFSDMLKEYIHYIPILEDLSDLIEKIKWCIDNDKECKKIAKNAEKFYNEYLTKDAILNYMQTNLNIISSNKNYTNLLNIPKKISIKKKNVAIISCFRDKGNGMREAQKNIFIPLMNRLLIPYCNFKIYIIEQSEDGFDFNIGKLKNIGFEISSSEEKFDNYIFCDIDTIPDYHLMEYFLNNYKYPVSLAVRGTRYEYKNIVTNKPFLGAMIMFNSELFKKINGYPNNFWGWGGEDDALLNRIINNKMNTIYYPKNGSIIDFEENIKMSTINNIQEKVKNEKKDLLKYEKLFNDIKYWNNNGINNLNYKILKNTEINDYTKLIKVDLLKKKDEKEFKEWFPSEIQNYKFLGNDFKKKWKDIKIESV